jgi:hypothetical protein
VAAALSSFRVSSACMTAGQCDVPRRPVAILEICFLGDRPFTPDRPVNICASRIYGDFVRSLARLNRKSARNVQYYSRCPVTRGNSFPDFFD